MCRSKATPAIVIVTRDARLEWVQGAPWKKNDESDVHLPKTKQLLTLLFPPPPPLDFFIAFLGVS
jgi:hypothetical protein